MKVNLETIKKELLSFPNMVKDPTSNEQDAITWHWNFLKKFKGFEKELRNRLEQAKKFENDNNQDKIWRLKSIGFQDAIKEILGET